MSFSFEITETDLMGRIGELTVAGKLVETPCLFPVVHPVSMDIPLSLFEEMGFRALMTNSFTVYKRRREEALEKGIHKMLEFDGILMTDSGGYQVLEYGELNLDPITIADFQSRIGSDLAVTLDKPTGFSRSKKYATDTVDVSYRGALDTIRKLGESDTVWVGPIQGGLFDELVAQSTRNLVQAGFKMLALGSPTQIMENYLFDELVKMIMAAKQSMPYSTPLHLFGAGHPLTMALSVALGCDTFDSASYILFAKQGRYMTERGTLKLEKMTYLPCSCPVCISTSSKELSEMEKGERAKKVAIHNLYVLREELLKCKEAIAEGRLWDLVEEKANSHPSVTRAFIEMARRAESLTSGTPMLRERGLMVRSKLDRLRPELSIARDHLHGVFRKRARSAALIGSDENKPLVRMKVYQDLLSRSKGRDIDLYRVHPDLGVYPAELEFVYPFTQTIRAESPTSARVLKGSIRRLRTLGYTKILLCNSKSVRRTI